MATSSITGLQNKYGSLSSQLASSPTAYAPKVDPTSKDLSLTKQLAAVNKQIEDTKSTQLRNRWYGPSDVPAEETGQNDGPWLGALKALQKPLNAVAGVAQYAVGEGQGNTLAENINMATKSGLTFGNVMQQKNVPWAVAAPLGFMLDVGMDPVNWLTMGSTALVPRVAGGFLKGGLTESVEKAGLKAAVGSGWDLAKASKAAATGLTSSLERKAATALGFVPFAKKLAKGTIVTAEEAAAKGVPLTLGDQWRNLLIKSGKAVTDLKTKVGEKAIMGAEKYDTLMGANVADRLGKGLFGMPSGIIGETAETWINKFNKAGDMQIFGKKVPTGEKIVDFFKYSPSMAAKVADIKDRAILAGKKLGLNLEKDKSLVHFATLDEYNKLDAAVKAKDTQNTIQAMGKILTGEADQVVKMEKIRDSSGKILPAFKNKLFNLADSKENAAILLNIAQDSEDMKLLTKAYHETPLGKTGMKWYDDAIDRAKATTYSDIGNYIKTKTGLGTPSLEKAALEGAEETVNAYNGALSLRENISNLPGAVAGMSPGSWKPFDKILTGLETFTSIFKQAKVPLNIGSHVVATLGNFFMGAMMGLPVWKPGWLNSMNRASKLLRGELGTRGIRELFFNDLGTMAKMIDDNPTRFKQLFGFGPEQIQGKIDLEHIIRGKVAPRTLQETADWIGQEFDRMMTAKARGRAIEKAEFATMTPLEIAEYKAEEAANDLIYLAADKAKKAQATAKSTVKELRSYPTPAKSMAESLRTGPLKATEEMTGPYTAEFNDGNKTINTMKLKYELLAKDYPDNYFYNFVDKFLNGMPKWYEQIDQTNKIGATDYLINVGLTEAELIRVSQNVPIDFAKDVVAEVVEGGEKLYKLDALKAGEIAMETFMNYAAMPDFVKTMRALPIVGSNFYSFQYAMAIKNAKTMINNPAVFNKIGFMLNEFSGLRTPEEKAALTSKYNAYLNSPTVVKVLGMWNTNVKNIIPIYGMNMFAPSEKTYSDTAQGNFLRNLDRLPVMQTPVGQVIKDYWLQPWILSGTGEAPQGTFGQPLFPSFDEAGNPIKASLGTKAFYAGRTLAEAAVPGSLSYLGVPLGLTGMSPEAINLIPSYGARSIANATQGRSSIGAMTKEDAVRKTFRTILARTGLPAYTLDTKQLPTPAKMKVY